MEEGERQDVSMSTTHFNLHYHKARAYTHIHSTLSSLSAGCNELWCLITNTARALKYGAKGMKIPRHFSPYKGNPRQLSHKRMVLLLDKMVENGYLVFYRGGLLKMSEEQRLLSIYMFTDKYLSLWQDVDVSKEKNEYNFIQVRDRLTQEHKTTKGIKGAEQMRMFMEQYNTLLENTSLAVDGKALPIQQYARIFTDSVDKGGRYYNTTGGIQVVPSRLRSYVEINKERVVELDFCALHPNILYERVERETGIVVDIDDPYSVDISSLFAEDSTICTGKHNPARVLVKQVFLKGLNAKDIRSAAGSVTESWYEEYKKGKDGAFYGLSPQGTSGTFPAKALCELVANAHPLIKDAFFSDCGLLLQRIDSDIITLVLKNFMDIGVCALSWHDSVVVPAKYKEMLHAQMVLAYTTVIGSGGRCKIDTKES
jgi:hypothetical protein